ncbi:MAG: hypothetical protein Q4F21_05645 [Lachnospiraceae bacterium]|nr:hypothetical protein [Lachnospiraceae bacterium]
MGKQYRKIILAGADNICESIMSEAIFKNIAGDRPLEIISRGLVVLFPEPVNPKAETVLKQNNLQPSKHYSEELTIDDVTADTLILTMKESQAQKIIATMDPDCDIATLRGFVGYKGDPVTPSGDVENYQLAFEHLDLLVKAAAQIIFAPIDEELAKEPKPLSPRLAEKVVKQLPEALDEQEAVQEEDEQDTARMECKLQTEKKLEEEYWEVVKKTAEREAAREAAKEAEVSEYKLLYEEIKAKNKSDNRSDDAKNEENEQNVENAEKENEE